MLEDYQRYHAHVQTFPVDINVFNMEISFKLKKSFKK